MGYFAQQSLDVLDSNLTIIEQLQKDFPQDGLGVTADSGRSISIFGRRGGQASTGVVRRREITPGDGANAL